MIDLTGRSAVVTGGSRGIGRAIVLRLATQGADVTFSYRGNAVAAEETVAGVAALGRRAIAVQGDVVDPATAEGLVKTALEAFGKVDILVNNAGITRRAPAVDVADADWDEVLGVNLDGVFTACRAAGRHMLARGSGKIINTASLLSFTGGLTVAGYAASKGGVAQLTKALSNEWAGKGVQVNAIAPGYMRTANTAALQDDPVRAQEILGRIPAGRWGEPSDLEGTIVFLASAASDYLTGQVLAIDGGWCGR